MNLDWGSRARLQDHRVLLHQRTSDRSPRVTIGMPTFTRAHTIRRALASIANQSFRDFVLVISDNAGVDQATIAAVKEIAGDLPEVYLVAQESNIGALSNLNFLLALAETDFFLWLADDDEISANYLAEMVAILDSDPAVVTAMGGWYMMKNEKEGRIIPQLKNSGGTKAARIFKYVSGRSDDSFFYGLHRTSCLKECQFSDYYFPNVGVVTNRCYVLLFDMVWQGRIEYTNKANWICHNYSEKQYNVARATGFGDRLKTLARRLNVYALYCAKTAKKGPYLLPVVVPASLIGFTGDAFGALRRIVRRRITKRANA